MRCVNKGERKVELSLQHNECSEIIHMFCDECKRATLLIGGRLRIDKISYKNSTFPFRFQAWLSANAFNMWKGIEATFCQVDQRLPKITFDPMDQKWSYFYVCLYKNSIGNRGYCSAIFGRSISDEMKLNYADDMGVWLFCLIAMQL